MYSYVLYGEIKLTDGDVNTFNKNYNLNIANTLFKDEIQGIEIKVKFNNDKTYLCYVNVPQSFYDDWGFENIDGLTNWIDNATLDIFYDAILTYVYEKINMPLDNIVLDTEMNIIKKKRIRF